MLKRSNSLHEINQHLFVKMCRKIKANIKNPKDDRYNYFLNYSTFVEDDYYFCGFAGSLI